RAAELALDPWRLHGDRFQCSLPADTAGRARVEAPPDAFGVEGGRIDLDRVRGEIGRRRGPLGTQALGQAEAEGELLVVAGRAHGDRHRLAGDPDLERLLDRNLVVFGDTARHP